MRRHHLHLVAASVTERVESLAVDAYNHGKADGYRPGYMDGWRFGVLCGFLPGALLVAAQVHRVVRGPVGAFETLADDRGERDLDVRCGHGPLVPQRGVPGPHDQFVLGAV